jgi:hypothetical protein
VSDCPDFKNDLLGKLNVSIISRFFLLTVVSLIFAACDSGTGTANKQAAQDRELTQKLREAITAQPPIELHCAYTTMGNFCSSSLSLRITSVVSAVEIRKITLNQGINYCEPGIDPDELPTTLTLGTSFSFLPDSDCRAAAIIEVEIETDKGVWNWKFLPN